jgi:hypothetical protein
MLILLDPRFRRPDGLRYNVWLARRRARERRLVRAVARRIAQKLRRSVLTSDETAEAVDVVRAALANARESYQAPSISIPTTVILSAEFEQHDPSTWCLGSVIRRPWRCKRLPGQHSRLLLPPTVDVVAGEIRAVLDEAVAAQSSA